MRSAQSPAKACGAIPARLRLCRSLPVVLLAVGTVAVVMPGTAPAVQASKRPHEARSGAILFASDAGHGSAGRAATDSANPAVISMATQLADNLALLFEKFGDSEFVVCIEGSVDDAGVFRLRDFRMPHIAYSRTTSTGVHPDGGCGQYPGIVGTLHSHPPTYPQDRGRESDNCYLSRPDIVSWLEYTSYPYTMVMCGPRLWAWWHRSQLDGDRVLAFPPRGQLQGRPVADLANR